MDVNRQCIDLMSITGHKLYGPKGAGALYVRSKNPQVRVAAMMDGGGHEQGMRSGTLNVAGIAALAAVPSNCPHVAVRIKSGEESKDYVATYREAQKLIEAETPADFETRGRAYLLLKRHGQEICKRAKPKCEECPVNAYCAFFAGD